MSINYPKFLPSPAIHRRNCVTAASKLYKYTRRIMKFDQMDFEFASWQILYLLVAPQKVYRNFQCRKQTKEQFARDDPAFLVFLIACICCTSGGLGIILKLTLLQILHLVINVVLLDFFLTSLIVATLFWYVTNNYCKGPQITQTIEWGFTFDVHLNAFCPTILLIHFHQLFFLSGLVSHECILSILIGNTVWFLAMSYYIYITFLGYKVLPFLENTILILWCFPVLLLWFVFSILIRHHIMYALLMCYKNRVAFS